MHSLSSSLALHEVPILWLVGVKNLISGALCLPFLRMEKLVWQDGRYSVFVLFLLGPRDLAARVGRGGEDMPQMPPEGPPSGQPLPHRFQAWPGALGLCLPAACVWATWLRPQGPTLSLAPFSSWSSDRRLVLGNWICAAALAGMDHPTPIPRCWPDPWHMLMPAVTEAQCCAQ